MFYSRKYLLDDIFDNAFRSFDIAFKPLNKQPISDFVLSDDGTKYVLEVMVPGYSKSDITLEHIDDKLFISGKSKKYGDFKKEYWNINSGDVNAIVENGILTIEIGTNNVKRLIEIK